MVSRFLRWSALTLGCFAVAGLSSTNAGCGECMAACTSGARITVRVPVPDDDPQRLALRVCVEETCTELTYQPGPTEDGGTDDGGSDSGSDDGGSNDGGSGRMAVAASDPYAPVCLPYAYRATTGASIQGSCVSPLDQGRIAIHFETWSFGPDALGKDVRVRVEVRDTKTGETILSEEARDRVERSGEVCGQECGYAELGFE